MPTYKRSDLIRVGTRLLRKYRNTLDNLKPGVKAPGVERRLAAWEAFVKVGYDAKQLTVEQATLIREGMEDDHADAWDD